MDNPYLHHISFLADDIQRLQVHIAGNNNALLIASISNIEQRIWIDAALAWELAEHQTVLPRQLNLNDRLIPLLNASNQLATNHLLSIALDLPILSQEENLSVNQWRSQVRQWFGLLSQEREALTRHPLPVLFWIPSSDKRSQRNGTGPSSSEVETGESLHDSPIGDTEAIRYRTT